MKKIILTLMGAVLMMTACKKEEIVEITTPVENPAVKFLFKQYYNGTEVTNADFNTIQYTNAVGNNHSITKLEYLVSDITLHKVGGEEVSLGGYNLVNLADPNSRYYTPAVTVPEGKYTGVSITFGFSDENNTSGAYPDLNAASWGWPMMIGGGYHSMKFEGKFVDNTGATKGFGYHMGTASKVVGSGREFEPNHFRVQLWDLSGKGFEINNSEDVEIEINMNLAEWFTSPYPWDLNRWNSMLMPNYYIQKEMSRNGKTVFSLGNVNIKSK